MKFVLIILLFSIEIYSKKRCNTKIEFLKYYKLRSCYKSTSHVTSWKNVANVEDCIKFAREKSGLAFNFSPSEASDYVNGSTMICQVLGCPEIGPSSTLRPDIAFDYYSAYRKWKTTDHVSCLRSAGIFGLILKNNNYLESIEACISLGGDLADVLSEARTKFLSRLIKDSLQNWYKVAYVGLDDIEEEGNFVSSFGSLLSCTTYRAWAPGHPRSTLKNEDCVVLDADRMWRVVECKRKFPALCEFHPGGPLETADLQNISCSHVSNKRKKRKCDSRRS